MSSSESGKRNAAWGVNKKVNKKRRREFSYDMALERPYREARMTLDEMNGLQARFQGEDESTQLQILRDQWIQNREDELEVFLTNVKTNINSGLGAEDLLEWKNQSAALEEAVNRNSNNFVRQRKALLASIKQVSPPESPGTLEYEIGECVFDTLHYVAGIDAYLFVKNQRATVAQTIEHLDPEYNIGRRELVCDNIDKPLVCCNHSDMRDNLLKKMYEQLDIFSSVVLGGSKKKREKLVYSIGPKRSVKQMLSGVSPRWTNVFNFVKKSGIRHRLALGIHFAIVEQNLANINAGIRTKAEYTSIFSNSTVTPSKAVQKLIETHECVAVEYMALLWRIFTGDGSFKDADPVDGEPLLPKIPSYNERQTPTFQQSYAPQKPNADAELEEWRALHFMRRVVYSSASQDWFLHSASSAMLLSILFGAATQEGWGAMLSTYGNTAYTNILREELRDTTIKAKMAYAKTYLWQSVNSVMLRKLGFAIGVVTPSLLEERGLERMDAEEHDAAQRIVENNQEATQEATKEFIKALAKDRAEQAKDRAEHLKVIKQITKNQQREGVLHFMFKHPLGVGVSVAIVVTILVQIGKPTLKFSMKHLGGGEAFPWLSKIIDVSDVGADLGFGVLTLVENLGIAAGHLSWAFNGIVGGGNKVVGGFRDFVGGAANATNATGGGGIMRRIGQKMDFSSYTNAVRDVVSGESYFTGPAKSSAEMLLKVNTLAAFMTGGETFNAPLDNGHQRPIMAAVQMSVGAMAIDPGFEGGEITHVLSSKTAKDDNRASDRAYNLSSSQLSAVFGVFPHRRAIALKGIFPDGPKGASMLEDTILAKMKLEEEFEYDMD